MRICAALTLAALIGLPPVCGAQEAVLRHVTTSDGLADNFVTQLFEDARGYIWIATAGGVSRFDGSVFVTYRPADGLPRAPITTIDERGGTLWLATRGGRTVRVNDTASGPPFLSDGDSPSFATLAVADGGARRVPPRHPFAERAFDRSQPVAHRMRAAVADVLEDRQGNLWIATRGGGVFIVPAEPIVTYTPAHELPDAHVLRIVEARNGRIYAVTRRGGVAELREDGVEAVPGSLFAPFHTMGGRIAQDELGAWWFGTDAGVFTTDGPELSFALARRAADVARALPGTTPRSYTDSRGWTWEALPDAGVSLCTDRGCIDYSRADGIGHEVSSIAEDAFGRVYFGTARGLVRFDPRTRRFAEISSGFKASAVTHCLRDARGRMWIATRRGASYLVPRAPHALRPAQVYLTGVIAGATDVAMPPRGAITIDPLNASSGLVRFDYVAPGIGSTAGVQYQHRLTPIEREWSRPHSDRSQTYPALAAGVYTFTVRTIADDGTTSPPASVRIHVERPIWSWWWSALAGALLLLGARSLRKLQGAHGRGDLSGMPLRVLGGMEEEPQDGGRHGGASDGSRFLQR